MSRGIDYGRNVWNGNGSVRISETVRLHPATDWFMRGVVHATVTSKRERNGQTVIYLQAHGIGPAKLRIKVTYRDILHTCSTVQNSGYYGLAPVCYLCGEPIRVSDDVEVDG